MITNLQLLRNIGQFDSVSSGANLPLSQLSLIYAENSRGKTTLAAVLRSLASGNPNPIAERHRLLSQDSPEIVIESDTPSSALVFKNNSWSQTLPEIVIFDDVFVDENVYSGLVIGADHRQKLHGLILGSRGIELSTKLRNITDKIEKHNSALREKASVIPDVIRAGLTVDQFCALTPIDNIEDEIQNTKRRLAAASEQDQVRNTPTFDTFSLPSIDTSSVNAILSKDIPSLDAEAMRQVENHFKAWGAGAETWISEGMTRLSDAEGRQTVDDCPFCAQSLAESPLLSHYRMYFSDAYTVHAQDIAHECKVFEQAHSGQVIAAFERALKVATARHHLWSRFCEIPDIALDTAHVARCWQTARDTIVDAFKAKQGAPLEPMQLSQEALSAIAAYEDEVENVKALNASLQASNKQIEIVKEQAASADSDTLRHDLARLLAVKERYSDNVSKHCAAYLSEKSAKTSVEAERTAARAELETHRASAFPGYETAINLYLERFNAGFRLDNVKATDTRGGPTCNYNVVINTVPVPIAGGDRPQGKPAFRNTLSAGDRNTLALAFFFASIDQDPNAKNKIVVIDDPISSFDEHRSLTTVQELRRLAAKTEQVIVLSHRKSFLCQIWDSSDQTSRAAIRVARVGSGSTLVSWDVSADSETEHDRRHALLKGFMNGSATSDQREAAIAIRPVLESFLRIAYPEDFPVSTLLGPFRNTCNQRVGSPQEILCRDDIDELSNLTEYANRFHHDTNPAWETEQINDGELIGFIQRTLAFTKK
jgi:wobble nucleotide-excising tRNase